MKKYRIEIHPARKYLHIAEFETLDEVKNYLSADPKIGFEFVGTGADWLRLTHHGKRIVLTTPSTRSSASGETILMGYYEAKSEAYGLIEGIERGSAEYNKRVAAKYPHLVGNTGSTFDN